MAAGIARLIEICFVVPQIGVEPQVTPDGTVPMVATPFQHLPPFVSGISMFHIVMLIMSQRSQLLIAAG